MFSGVNVEERNHWEMKPLSASMKFSSNAKFSTKTQYFMASNSHFSACLLTLMTWILALGLL